MYGGRPCDKEQGSKQEEKCNQDSCIGKTQYHQVTCLFTEHYFIDACQPNPCYHGVTCSNVNGSLHLHRCGPCPVGMTGDGTHCEPVNEVSNILNILFVFHEISS